MAPVTHVTVTAPPRRKTPIAAADGVEPGGGLLYVTEDDVCRVRYSHTILRSINRGDLILCNMDGAPVKSIDDAVTELPDGVTKIAKGKAAAAKAGGAK